MPPLKDPLDPYPHADLAAGIGALQLMPENADRMVRLEYLAGMVATRIRATGWRSPMSSDAWEGLVNGSLVIPPEVVRK